VLLLIIAVLQEIFIGRFRRRNSNFVLCYRNVFCDQYECNERDIVINHVTGDAITAAAPAAVGRTPSTLPPPQRIITHRQTLTQAQSYIETWLRNETAAAVNVVCVCEYKCLV